MTAPDVLGGGEHVERVQPPLQVGMRVRIRSMDDAAAPQYGTRIEDISGDFVAVQRPTDRYRPVRFPPGTPVELLVTVTDVPGKEGQYRSDSVVLRELSGRVPLLQLELPATWERAQLREFFRVPVSIPVKVRVEAEDVDDDAKDEWAEGWMRDISGGGCQMLVPLPLEREERVTVEFDLWEQTLRIPATVTRSVPEDIHRRQYVVGVEFTAINEQQREHIIRFAFQRQIELRKKGMA